MAANTYIYMIGQRVIYNGNVICTVCKPERKGCTELWIDNPAKGYPHFVDPNNLRPLPGGQL
jgi:hypothetical protein